MGTQFKSGGNSENLREQFNALRDDVAAIRTALIGVTAQIDADSGDTGGDTTYGSGNNPAALTSADLTLGL
jgi:hypothetical protein